MKLTHKKKLLIFKVVVIALIIALGAHLKYFYKVPDIDMRVIASALGIDKTENGKIKVSAHILIPVAAAGSESVQDFAEAEADTVSEALNKLNVVTGAQVEVLQCGMIVLGERLCADGVMEHLKSIHSAGRVKAGVLLISADGMEASEYLKAELKTADEPPNRVENLITYFENTLNMPNLTLVRFLSGSVTESNSSYMPCITLDVPKEEGAADGQQSGNKEKKVKNADSGEKDPGSTTKLKTVSRTAVFANGKKIGVLDENGTRGVIFTEKISNKGYIGLPDFKYYDKDYGFLAGDVIATHSKIKVKFVDGKPHVTFKIRADMELRERYPFTPDLDSGMLNEHDFYKAIGEAFAGSIRDDIDAAVNAQKEMNVDFLQLKYKFARLCSKELKNYYAAAPDNFNSDLTYSFDIKCKVK